MCIWKCCVSTGKHGQKGWSHNEFKGANEEFCSCLSARRIHSQRWQGSRCYFRSSPRTKTKDRTSCEKTPYLDHRDDDAKMTQMNGHKSKMSRWAAGRKMVPNRVKNSLGQPAWSDRPNTFSCWFGLPFDLAPPRSISSSCLWRPLHPIIPSTSIHQKVVAARWGRELDKLIARINTDGGKEARRGLQAISLKNKKERGREREEGDSWRDREMPKSVIYDFNTVYKAVEIAMYARG
jgi:hypothetical protein